MEARRPEARFLTRLLATLFLGVVAAGCAAPPSEDPSLRRGRDAFVAGDYLQARDLFREAAAAAPDSSAAILGVARSSQQLHDYEQAVPAFESTLDLNPSDALAWEGLLETLYWQGSLRGNGAALERVLQLAPRALVAAPDNVQIYAHALRAAAELNRLYEFVPLLEVVAETLPDEPVLAAHLSRARIDDARRTHNVALAEGDPRAEQFGERVAELEARLQADVEERDQAASSTEPVAGQVYALALGYDTLGDDEQAGAAFDRLERLSGGDKMALPYRYEQFMDEWMASMNAGPDERLAIIDRWAPRFAPRWDNNATEYRSLLGQELDYLVRMARQVAREDVETLEVLAERIASTGRRLARIDTWRRAARYVETVSVLAMTPSQYVTAVRVAEEGEEQLRADAPGLLHPSTPDTEREELRLRYLSVLMQLQGQALHNLGRDDEAEEVLRRAIAEYPVAASYAVLGGLLLDAGRAGEAFDLFVASLANGFGPAEAGLEEQTRASALEAASAIGASMDVVDAAIAFAAERVAEERDRAIVAEPLDLPAPAFDLTDMNGSPWRSGDLLGRVVVLNYWATWCAPCIAEMPYWERLVEEYAQYDDVVFLAISTDMDVDAVPRFLEANDYTFPVAMDQGSATDFAVPGVPAGFIIGKDGLIKYRSSGFPGPDRYLREMRLRIDAQRQAGQ